VVHKVLKEKSDKFRDMFEPNFDEEFFGFAMGTDVTMPDPMKPESKDLAVLFGNTLVNKNLTPLSPKPLEALYSVISECTVTDVDACIKHFVYHKKSYMIAGFDEFYIIKDNEASNKVTLFGTFNRTDFLDAFVFDATMKSLFSTFYLPPSLDNEKPVTAFVTRNTQRYGWTDSKRTVGSHMFYFRHATKDPTKNEENKTKAEWQAGMEARQVSCVMPSTQIGTWSSEDSGGKGKGKGKGKGSENDRNDVHILFSHLEKDDAVKHFDKMKPCEKDINADPYLKDANEKGLVMAPLTFSLGEVVAAL